jgi:hypothetical protein
MQQPGESFEAALDRALLTEEGSALYEDRKSWLAKDVPMKRTSRDAGRVKDSLGARQAVASVIEERAAKAFPSLSRPQAVTKFLGTAEGAEAYERYRRTR